MFPRKLPLPKAYPPQVIPKKEECAPVIVEKSYVSVVREQEITPQLGTKSVEPRENGAMNEDYWELHHKAEMALMKSRKLTLDMEKERSASIKSLPTPRSICVERHYENQNGKCSNNKVKETWSVFNAGKYLPQEMNAFEKAAIVSETQKKIDEEKQALEAKRENEAKQRFLTALKKNRIQKEYTATMAMIKKTEKQYHHENAQRVAQVPPDRITTCAPVNIHINMDKQQKLEEEFEKMLPKVKEHAIEDLEGYKDELEDKYYDRETHLKVSPEKFGHSRFKGRQDLLHLNSLLRPESFEERYYPNREPSIDSTPSTHSHPPADILNMAYIESLSPDQPPFTSSPIQSIQPTTRDFGIQVDVPVSIGVQVDLLTSEERIESSISEPFIDEVNQRRKFVSVGIQTDYVIVINPSDLSPSLVFTSSHQQSLPSQCRASMFPSLFISQNESKKSSDATSSKVDSSKYHTALSVSRETELETSKLRQKIEQSLAKNRTKEKRYFPPISLGLNSSPESSDRLRRLQKNTNFVPTKEATPPSYVPIRAIPLSEPIRDRSAATSIPFVLGGTTEVIADEDSVTTESHSFIDDIETLSNIRKHIYSQLKNETIAPSMFDKEIPENHRHVNNTSPSSTEVVTQSTTQGREDYAESIGHFPAHPLNTSETTASVSSHPFSFVQDPSDSFQSCLDIRKEELPSISMLTNLSAVEISHTSELENDKAKSSMVTSSTTDTVPDGSVIPSKSTDTRSEINKENLKMISYIICKQLKDAYPSLENASSEHYNHLDNQKSTPRVCWLRNGEPFFYHELSTIQEGDSALADITSKSSDDVESESSSFQLLLDHIQQSEKEGLDSTPTSLVTELSEVSHILEKVKILPQSPNIATSFLSGAKKHNLVEDAVVSNHSLSSKVTKNLEKTMMGPLCSSPSSTAEKTMSLSPSVDSLSVKHFSDVSQDSRAASSTKSPTIPSDSTSSSQHVPITMKTLMPSHQVFPKPFDHKSESEENALLKTSSDPNRFPTSKVQVNSDEYYRIIEALVRNYSPSPPPQFPMASQNHNNMLPVSSSTLPAKRHEISGVSHINPSFNVGELAMLTSNGSSSPSTKSSSLPELSPSTLTKEPNNYCQLALQSPISLPQSPVPSLGQESISSSQSTHGSFQPLSLILPSTSNGSSDISQGTPDSKPLLIPASSLRSYDVAEEVKTPTFSSQYHIPTSSFSPLSYVAEIGSDSPESETLKPESMIFPKTISYQDVAVYSPSSIDQGASCQGVTKHSSNQNFQVPLSCITDSGSAFQALTLENTNSSSPSCDTQLKKVIFENDSNKTLTPPIAASDAGQSSNPISPLLSMSDIGTFHPLTLVDTPTTFTSSPREVASKTSSSSSSNASLNYKPAVHKAVARVSKKHANYDLTLMRKLCAKHLATQESGSSSDESLSRMFTTSRIAHHSTPVKTTDNPEEIPEVDEKDDEATLTKSNSVHSFNSVEHARYILSSNSAKMVTEETFQSRTTTYVETLVETNLVSVVVQSDPDEYNFPSTDKMSQSMLSFLQHEESVTASPNEHVSLLSEDFSTPSIQSQEVNQSSQATPRISLLSEDFSVGPMQSHKVNQSSWKAPKTPSITVEDTASCADATSSQFSTPSCLSSEFSQATPSSSSAKRTSPQTSSGYKQRTRRLWNNLEEVKAKQQLELKKRAMAQNKEKVKELQLKLRKKRKPHTQKRE